MASTSFINTFSEMTITDGNPTDGASFTKEQLEQWAKNAAEVSNKTDSDSGSDNETKSTRKQRKTKATRRNNHRIAHILPACGTHKYAIKLKSQK